MIDLLNLNHSPQEDIKESRCRTVTGEKTLEPENGHTPPFASVAATMAKVSPARE